MSNQFSSVCIQGKITLPVVRNFYLCYVFSSNKFSSVYILSESLNLVFQPIFENSIIILSESAFF